MKWLWQNNFLFCFFGFCINGRSSSIICSDHVETSMASIAFYFNLICRTALKALCRVGIANWTKVITIFVDRWRSFPSIRFLYVIRVNGRRRHSDRLTRNSPSPSSRLTIIGWFGCSHVWDYYPFVSHPYRLEKPENVKPRPQYSKWTFKLFLLPYAWAHLIIP